MLQNERNSWAIRPQTIRMSCGKSHLVLCLNNFPKRRPSCTADAQNEDLCTDLPASKHIVLRWEDSLKDDIKTNKTIANVLNTLKVGSIVAAAISPIVEMSLVVPTALCLLAYGFHRIAKHFDEKAKAYQIDLNEIN